MSVTLIGGNGLFDVVGGCLALIDQCNTAVGANLSTGITWIKNKMPTARTDLAATIYTDRDNARTAFDSLKSALTSRGSTVIIQMVNDDNKISALTLTAAMTELIVQMEGTSDTVDANTVSVAVTTGSANVGTTAVAASVTDEFGKTLEYAYDEDLVVTCASDSQSGGATAFQESLSMSGEVAQTNKLAWDWPKGSGTVNKSVPTCNPALNAQTSVGGNILTNSDWEDWTVTNTPDNWSITVGAATTNVLKETTNVFKAGGFALALLGDAGGTLTTLEQTITTLVEPNKVYCLGFWGRKTTGLAAGVVTISLVDGSGNTIANDASTNNSSAFTASGWTTAYVFKSAFFQTPKNLPTAVKIRIKVTTGLTDGEYAYIDQMGLCEATQAYTSEGLGPYVAAFGGSVAPTKGDNWTVAVSNNYGGQVQTGFWRMFNMHTLGTDGLILPSDSGGTETVADTVVTLS